MSENLTTRFYRDQMKNWSEQKLVNALGYGLPWHEHAAARELLSQIRGDAVPNGRGVTLTKAPGPNHLPLARIGLTILAVAAASSFAYHWRQRPVHDPIARRLLPTAASLFHRLGIHAWAVTP
jgi:hypothetical protein